MIIIRDDSLYDTDDYEMIQSAYEDYLYGSHRGKDVNKKEYDMKDGSLIHKRIMEKYDGIDS
jgi:hypothetical protein